MMRTERLRHLPDWCRLGCVALLGAFLLGCETDVPTDAEVSADVSAETVTAEAVMATDIPQPVIRVHAPRVPGAPSELLDRPLVVVDGVALSPEEAASESFMRGFEIKSIEVMRGTDAIGRFGERAANGVVLLTTKD